MSISIYYTAKRDHPLTAEERTAVERLIADHSVDDAIKRYEKTRRGPNWESFCVYDPAEPSATGVIFEGATRLPDSSEKAMWEGLQHWSALLSGIRRLLSGADWHVHVDDHDLVWDDRAGEYDPSQ